MTDDDTDDLSGPDLVDDRGELGKPCRRDVRLDRLRDRIEEVGQLPEQAAAAGQALAQGDDDLLLTRGPGEVTLAGPLRTRA